MEYEEHMETLIRNRFTLVQHLQVERPFLLDYLLSKRVFDRDDYDLVRSEKTREQKASKILDIIETKGENGFKHFKDVLQLINPSLYETLTGEKATYRESPIIETICHIGDGNRLIDQDILSSHLKRVTDDLRDMTLRYNTLLKEDQQLRKALHVSKHEQEMLESRLEFLENQLAETEAAASETYSNANISLMNQYEAMQRDRNDNKDFIIQLQMKLLQSQEESEKRTRELEECKAKCDTLEHQLSEVNENYIIQRSETKKLSAKLKCRAEEAMQCENLKQQCREKQFQVMELKTSLDDMTKELEEVKNWAEALKNRYDTVLEERNEMLVKQHTTVENLSHSQNNNTDLKIKINRMTRELTELKKDRAKLDKEVTMFRNQAKTQNEAYLKATEKIEETKAYFKDLLESKDKDLSEKQELVDYYQEEVESLKTELRQSKDELGMTLKENDELVSQLKKLRMEFDMTVESLEEEISKWEDSQGNDIEDADQGTTRTKENDEHNPKDKQGPVGNYNWKKRLTSDLVKSIRKRFTKIPEEETVSLTDKREILRKSHSYDSWLEQMAPVYNALPLESRNKFSLERTYGQKPMKTLPFETLAHMYSEGSRSTDFSLCKPNRTSVRGVSSSTSSLPFYDRLRMKHPRKSSSPLPLSECDPFEIQQLREYVDEKWRDEDRDRKVPCQDEENGEMDDDIDDDIDGFVYPKASSDSDDNNNISSPPKGKKMTTFRPRTHAMTADVFTTERKLPTEYNVRSAPPSKSDIDQTCPLEKEPDNVVA